MKKVIAAIVAGVGLLLAIVFLSSCTTEVVREVQVTQAPRDTVPAGPTAIDYANFVNHVNSQSFVAQSISDYDIRTYGDNVCGALDSGDSFGDVVTFLRDNSGYLTDDDAAFIASVVWAAVAYLCPEYEPEMNAFLNGGGA